MPTRTLGVCAPEGLKLAVVAVVGVEGGGGVVGVQPGVLEHSWGQDLQAPLVNHTVKKRRKKCL